MNPMPSDVARRRPANLPARRDPNVIDGEVKMSSTAKVLNGIVLLLLAAFFAGFLLSTL